MLAEDGVAAAAVFFCPTILSLYRPFFASAWFGLPCCLQVAIASLLFIFCFSFIWWMVLSFCWDEMRIWEGFKRPLLFELFHFGWSCLLGWLCKGYCCSWWWRWMGPNTTRKGRNKGSTNVSIKWLFLRILSLELSLYEINRIIHPETFASLCTQQQHA